MITLEWTKDDAVRFNPGTKLHQHLFSFSKSNNSTLELFNGKNEWVAHCLLVTVTSLSVVYSSLNMNITFSRQLQNTLFRTYCPSALVVILSWLSFWMALDAVPARVTLCVTSLLALVTQFANEGDDLPAATYVNVIILLKLFYNSWSKYLLSNY